MLNYYTPRLLGVLLIVLSVPKPSSKSYLFQLFQDDILKVSRNMAEPDAVLPKGSWVLITGATGFLASRTIIQFLERGYRVRATTRDASKGSWLADLLSEYARTGSFELVSVPDHDVPGAFGEVIKGVSAVVHIAVVFNLDPDPNNSIPASSTRIQSILRAAAVEPSVKRFIYTSSTFAHVMPQPGTPGVVNKDTYNELAIQAAWAPPPYEASRILPIYFASKAEAEKTLWKFVAEEKPHFKANVVSPYMMTGKILNEKQMTSSLPPQMLDQLYRGDLTTVQTLPACTFAAISLLLDCLR